MFFNRLFDVDIKMLTAAVMVVMAACSYDTQTVECGAARCRPGELCTPDGKCAAVHGCGNGECDLFEECDDGNLTDDDGCDSNCTRTDNHNEIVNDSLNEKCDDGNFDDSDDCVGFGENAECGDGYVRTQSSTVGGHENCDDGNALSCGTCSEDCQVVQSEYAAGYLIIVDGAHLNDDETFILEDGFHPPACFVFRKTALLNSSCVQVNVKGYDNVSVVRQSILNAVASVSLNIDLIPDPELPSLIRLKHRRPTTFGNWDLTKDYETVIDPGFLIFKMSGGLGGDCSVGVSCKNSDDCQSGACELGVCSQ